MFQNWPAVLPRRGVLITTFEQVPFHEFLTSDELLLVQRRTPDTQGARDIMVPYDQIVGLKITEVVRPKTYRDAGFVGGKPGD